MKLTENKAYANILIMEHLAPLEIRNTVVAETEHLQQLPVYIPDNVRVHFHFSPHTTSEHVGNPDDFRSMIRHSDIVFMEEAGKFDEEVRADLRSISKGNTKVFKGLTSVTSAEKDYGFMDSYLKALFNSHVLVDCIDVASEPSMLSKVRPLMGSANGDEGIGFMNMGDNVDEYLELSLEQMQNWAVANNYREQLILAKIGPETTRLIDSTPRLKSKTEVDVLLTLGAAHTRVYRELKKLYPDRVTRSFNELPYHFRPHIQHLRSKLLGVRLDQESEERLVIDSYISSWARDFLPTIGLKGDTGTEAGGKLVRDLFSSFSDEEKKDFVDKMLSEDAEGMEPFISKLIRIMYLHDVGELSRVG